MLQPFCTATFRQHDTLKILQGIRIPACLHVLYNVVPHGMVVFKPVRTQLALLMCVRVPLQMQRSLILLLAGLVVASAQPFQPGQNLAPLGRHSYISLVC